MVREQEESNQKRGRSSSNMVTSTKVQNERQHQHQHQHQNDNDGVDRLLLPPVQTYFKSSHDEEMIRIALQKSSSYYFSCFDEEQIQTFIQSVQCKQYAPGQVILLEGCIDCDIDPVAPGSTCTSNIDSTLPSTATSTTSTSSTTPTTLSISAADISTDHTATNTASDSDVVANTSASAISQQQQDPTQLTAVENHENSRLQTELTTTTTSSLAVDSLDTVQDDVEDNEGSDHPSDIALLNEDEDEDDDDDENDWNLQHDRSQDSTAVSCQNSSVDNYNNGEYFLLPSYNSTKLESSSSPFLLGDTAIGTTSPGATTSLTSTNTQPPVPPQSNIPRSIYIIKKGTAQIWYQQKNSNETKTATTTANNIIANHHYLVNTIGPGTIFGEGGFLFGRPHSASVIVSPNGKSVIVKDGTATAMISDDDDAAADDDNNNSTFECWVMDIRTFRDYVLPSTNLRQIFHKYAQRYDSDNSNDKDVFDGDDNDVHHNNKLYVTMEDFLQAINEHQQLDSNYTARNMNLASKLYDALIRLRLFEHRGGKISMDINDEARFDLNDFCFFFTLLARPDPEIDVAFLLMDEQQTGYIGLDQLRSVLQPIFPHLDFHTQFFQRYFGRNGDQCIRSKIFSQFITDLQYEIGQQAFIRAVQLKDVQNNIKPLKQPSNDGYLSPIEMIRILTTSCGWNLPSGVIRRFETVYCGNKDTDRKLNNHQSETNNKSNEQKEVSISQYTSETKYSIRSISPGEQFFSFGDFMAFQHVLGNLHFICTLICRAQDFKQGPISADDLKVTNREYGLGGHLSRRQVEIIFDLFDLDNDGYISYDDTVEVCGKRFTRQVIPAIGPGDKLSFTTPPTNQSEAREVTKAKDFDIIKKISTEMKNFGIASVVGGLSVFLLHPIDLIKTRLMNQRRGSLRLYTGPIDCLQQVIRKEGLKSFLRGVQPHLLGVAMERSIKLQVHHLMQQAFHVMDEEKDFNRESSLLFEALAGGCAGACQLLVTNPMEISSIRLQMQGETARLLKDRGIEPLAPSNLFRVIKDLGFPGVYRGASACLVRDVPFSAIFFPSYVVCKEALVHHNSNFTGKATAADIFYAGTIAGIPASLLTTPADVVKCRLQSLPRPGEQSYTGIRDCVTKMYQQEGLSAFFQGCSMRILRIAPQFGLSLMIYENLCNLFGFDKASRPPLNLPIGTNDYANAFPSRPPNEPGIIESWIRSFSSEK